MDKIYYIQQKSTQGGYVLLNFLGWAHNALINLVVFGALAVGVLVLPAMLFGPQGDLSLDRYLGGERVAFTVVAQNGIPVEGFEVFVIKTEMTDKYGNSYPFWNGRSCDTGSDGTCMIEHLPSGEYLITEMTGNAGLEEYYAASFSPAKFILDGPSQVNIKATMVRR